LKTELPVSNKPLCQQNNLTLANNNLVAAKHLTASWYIFQDKALARSANTSHFTNEVSNARLTIADDPHQPPVAEAIQVLQWLDPRLTDQISSDKGDSDLPLIEVTREQPSEDEPQQTSSADSSKPAMEDALPNTMAVLLTGDGGWAEIDKNIARLLADKGIPTVALDSLSYFWKVRTPVDTASDIEKVINEYREKWQKQRVILIGFGADVLPFIANKLTEETQQHIALVALLGMGKTAAFEFRLSSWMDADKSTNRLPLPPEVKLMRWAKSVCIYGQDDPETQCATTAELGVKPISMPGDHHFDEKYEELVQHIIDNAKPLE
jgi:type IV secretory pathway VirJ component